MSAIPERLRKALDTQGAIVFRLPGEDIYHLSGEDGYTVTCTPYDKLGSTLPNATEENDYLKSVAALASHHRTNGGKTVLSRVITGRTSRHFTEVAENYFEHNRHAFCMVANLGQNGIWIMATPELLLEADEAGYHTMSLAGTRPAGTPTPWDAKNTEEQAIVTRYICQQWKDLGLLPLVDDTVTLRSNNIEHICTVIHAPANEAVTTQMVLDATAPTPAVCGIPLEQAKERIARHEKHPRGLYAGYITVVRDDSSISFVGLRCARLDNDGNFAAYAGGGITAGSIPESELRETELKSATLIKALLQTN